MQINRFHKFANNDYSMKYYAPEIFMPDFISWNAVLAKQQKTYDDALSVRNKYPKYLQGREPLAEQYMQDVDKNVTDITSSYTEKGITEGNRKMRDFTLNLNKSWQPGGLAYELENEYNEYQKAAENIDKYYKDQKAENSANREYSLAKLQEVTKNPINYNPQTGMYTRNAISPSLIPYVDISEEALKIAKEIKESGTTSIVKMSPFWFEKIKKEGVTPETVEAVTSSLLAQPKYQQQQQVELWKAKRQYTPEQLQQLEDQTKLRQQTNFESQMSQLDKIASSKKPQDIKDIQKQLQEEGLYDGKIDGVMGNKTKEALNQYKEQVKERNDKKVNSITADGILSQQIRDSYSKPLIAAFSRMKVDKELYYNKETDLKWRLQNQRQNTAAMVGAIQTLGKAPDGKSLVTPGLASPAETLEKMKQSTNETIGAAKNTFNSVVKASGLQNLTGTTNPQMVHEITEIRLRSKSPEDFAAQLLTHGFVGVTDAKQLYDFYSSPAAVDLKNSYEALNQANGQQKALLDTEKSLNKQYADTPQGKAQLAKIRKETGFKGSDEDLISGIVSNDKSLMKKDASVGISFTPGGTTTSVTTTIDLAKDFRSGVNDFLKQNKATLPVSLRGYTINATTGEGAELEKTVKDDFITGYTLGYTDGDTAGIKFKKVGSNSTVDLANVDMDKANIKFNIDGNTVSYYITAQEKGKDGKNVTAVVKAPKEHFGRLQNLALHMKREAIDTGDQSVDALANQLYEVTTDGSQMKYAVSDNLIVNEKNGRRLNDVIDPARSEKSITTFGNHMSIVGKEVEEPIYYKGQEFQKFKVTDRNAGGQRYMLTVKTDKGYLPVKNKDGGLYFDSSAEAGYFLTNARMVDQLPVEVDQKKVYNTNLTENQQKAAVLGVQGIFDDNSLTNDNDDN